MRQRYLVGTKLLETLSRGLFVLVCTYRLPLEEAGRFGLLATVIGLLSFVLGYERQIDMQRQMAGRSSSAIRRRMAETLRFFRAHYLLVLSISMLATMLADISARTLGLVAVVVIGEHLSNQGYQAVLLIPRAFSLLVAAAVKNSLQLLAVLYLSFLEPEALTALSVLQVWAIVSIGYVAIGMVWWRLWMREPLAQQGDELPDQTLGVQYRASALHFLVGLVAVATLQIDRLVVGGILASSDVGIYFRHIALTSVAFQIFNITSFNRVVPSVYQHARKSAWHLAAKVVKVEYLRFALVIISLVVLALLLDYLLGYPARQFGLQSHFCITMMIGVLFRTAADYEGLLLLSMGCDQTLLKNQATAAVLGAAVLFLLSSSYQLPGAFLGVMLSPVLYFILNRFSVHKRYVQLEASMS